MTNKGLLIELLLIKDPGYNDSTLGEIFLAPLNCKRKNDSNCLALCLEKKDGNYFQRLVHQLKPLECFGTEQITKQLVYVKEDNSVNYSRTKTPPTRGSHFVISFPSLLEKGFSISPYYTFSSKDVFRESFLWKDDIAAFQAGITRYNYGGAVMFTRNTIERFVLNIYTEHHGLAGVNVLVPERDQSLEDVLPIYFKTQSERERQQYLDRITKPIGAGLSVSVSLRRKSAMGIKFFAVSITATGT
jgi:hypothetical protein